MSSPFIIVKEMIPGYFVKKKERYNYLDKVIILSPLFRDIFFL